MKFIGLAITVHALCMAFIFSRAADGPQTGMVIAGLFLVMGLVYCLVDAASNKLQKARDGSR